MNIQTISIVVPTKGCVNKCKFCVSRMREHPNHELKVDIEQLKKRIKYAVMNNVNTCILTGTGEALQNTNFLNVLIDVFKEMDNPFPNIELQTTGVLLNEENINILKKLGVNTISISVSNIFDDDKNMDIIDCPKPLRFKLSELIKMLKSKGFNIRLSLNLTKDYDDDNPKTLILKCKELGAEQITFRKLYHNNDKSFDQTKWVIINDCNPMLIRNIKQYISASGISAFVKGKGLGEYLYTLPFGGKVYSIKGMSTVIDDDCMSKNTKDVLKYIILREDCRLYCRWDDPGSLIF